MTKYPTILKNKKNSTHSILEKCKLKNRHKIIVSEDIINHLSY